MIIILSVSSRQTKESTGQRKKNCRAISLWETQIQSILLSKDEVIQDYEANVSTSIKRLRTAQHEDIDNALLEWFRKARSKNIIPITGPMLQEKATKIAEVLKIPPEKAR